MPNGVPMKTLLITSILLTSTPAFACGLLGQPPCYQPIQPVQPLPPPISTYRPPTTIQQFGNTTTITTPGSPPVNCQRFGNTTTCR